MIGGRDVSWAHSPSLNDIRRVLSTIRLWWPEAVISDDEHAEIEPPTAIPCGWHVARDRRISALLEKDGVTDAVEPHFFSVYARSDAIHFVVGIADDCPGALLLDEILAVLDEARR
jgi:hypothetical protein